MSTIFMYMKIKLIEIESSLTLKQYKSKGAMVRWKSLYFGSGEARLIYNMQSHLIFFLFTKCGQFISTKISLLTISMFCLTQVI